MVRLIVDTLLSQVRTLWLVFMKLFQKKDTVEYPDQQPYMFPRWRGRIILSRDPDGEERCVACNLCAVACPVDCIGSFGDWEQCSKTCSGGLQERTYSVTTQAQGNGGTCLHAEGYKESQACNTEVCAKVICEIHGTENYTYDT